jgi:hypothetical protein
MGQICGYDCMSQKQTCDVTGKSAEQKTSCKSETDVIKTDCEDGCGWAVSSGGVDTWVNSHSV